MKMTYTYPTAFSSFGTEEAEAWDRVRASGRFTMGSETEQFEAELAAYHVRAHAIAVNSGSSANLVAVAAAHLTATGGWEPPDAYNAFVPAIAWATTYAPLAQLGYHFEVHDVDDTWNAPSRYYRGHPRRPLPAIIILCSILGNPTHYDDWISYPDIYPGVTIIEDNCEALGARTAGGLLTGTFGHMSTESFFYSHQASGIELGAILTDDPELNRLCRLLRNHGNAGWGQQDFDRLYDFQVFGFNVRPTELHCAIARAQLRKLDVLVASRRRNQEYFRQELANNQSVIFPRDTSQYTSPFGLAFRVETTQQRRKLVDALRAAGIDSRPPTGGSFTRHAYGEPWQDQPTPNADLVHDTGLFCGNPPWDGVELIDRLVKVMRDTL